MMEKSVLLIPFNLGWGTFNGITSSDDKDRMLVALNRDFWYSDGSKAVVNFRLGAPAANIPMSLSWNQLSTTPKSGYNGAQMFIDHIIPGERIKENIAVYGMRLRADRGARDVAIAVVTHAGSPGIVIIVPASKLTTAYHYYEIAINYKTGEINLYQDSAFIRQYRLYPENQKPETFFSITVSFGINPATPYLSDSNYTYAYFSDAYILVDDGDLGDDARLGPILLKKLNVSEFKASPGWSPARVVPEDSHEKNCLSNINSIKPIWPRGDMVTSDPIGTEAFVKFNKPPEPEILAAQIHTDVSKLPGSNAKLVTEVTMGDKTRDTSELIPMLENTITGNTKLYSQVQIGSLRNASGGITNLTNEDIENTSIIFKGKVVK